MCFGNISKDFTSNNIQKKKSLFDFKPLRIRFNKIDGFIRVYDGTRYLVLFGSKKYDSFYNRIRYLISVKSGITYIISYNYGKIKVDSYNSLPRKNNNFSFIML